MAFESIKRGWGAVKNGANKIKKGFRSIRKAFAFFSTFIGQIVFWILAILLIILLVYIIVTTIFKSISKLLKLDGGVQSNAAYSWLADLAASGYDEMLDAEELVEYHAFEYAVLMDAARFMEETGTTSLEVEDSGPIDFEALNGLSYEEKRQQWAFLAAFMLSQENGIRSATGISDLVAALNAANPGIALTSPTDVEPPEDPESQEPPEGYNNGFINANDFSTEHSMENLFYEAVENEYTGETSLMPYLKLDRHYDNVKYYIEYRDEGGEVSQEVEAAGTEWAFNQEMANQFIGKHRWEGQINNSYGGIDGGYSFILNHLYPSTIVHELNAMNGSAAGENEKVAAEAVDEVDIYKEYSESLYYTEEEKINTYKVPLKILLDRFLPNALLLSSWRLLSNNDETVEVDTLVDEIQKIYSEACWKDEIVEGDKLLVKDVLKINTAIDADTSAYDIFDNIATKEKIKENYLYGGETDVLYSAYEALFDSRTLEQNPAGANTSTPTNDPATNPTTNPSNNTQGGLTTIQTFSGGFDGDVIDDVRLILTHYSQNNNVQISEYMFNKIVDDVITYVTPKEEYPDSKGAPNSENGEYIIYTPLDNGEYLVNCIPLENDEIETAKKHYNLRADQDIGEIYATAGDPSSGIEKDHIKNKNPYTASEEVKECFVPFMKLAFTHKDGIRTTSIIISYKNQYIAYVVKGREIEDYVRMSNQNTFAYFESRDIHSTTVRLWDITQTGETSTERWVIEDAFEGLSLGINEFTLSLRYAQADGTIDAVTVTMTPSDLKEYFGVDLTGANAQGLNVGIASLIEAGGLKINGQTVTLDNCLSLGKTAIIRTPENGGRDYTGLLSLPTDASINGEYTGEYAGGNSTMTGGETVVTDRVYINLKSLGIGESDPVNVEVTGGVQSNSILSSIGSEKLKTFVKIAEYLETQASDPTSVRVSVSMLNNDSLVESANNNWVDSNYSIYPASLNATDVSEEFSVVFPTRRLIIPITQQFWDRTLRFYLVKGAKTWSSVKHFNNRIQIMGEYTDRSNFTYLISANPFCNGIEGYECTKDIDWRGNLYAPVFAGDSDDNTRARETDVLLLLSEWLDASEEGIRAADYYIRDLYSLINYSKGIKDEDGNYTVEPIKRENGEPYVNPDSYTYLYIPDEILLFDDAIAERAFWMDRLISTPEDPIDENTENYLRSKAETFTWQVVDYPLYAECQDDENSSLANAYLLWPYGDQMSTLYHAISANASDQEHGKVLDNLSAYIAGIHEAADLHGRFNAKEIYDEIFDSSGNARIKAVYSGGEVTLTGVETTAGEGLYFDNLPVEMKLGNKTYTFNGTAAATYGYELYRQTLISKNPEKAEELIKEQLEKEWKWTEIRAMAPGIVTEIESDSKSGFGVLIRHSDNMSTSYIHMKRYPLVQKGQYVGAGTLLGYEGTTGGSNGFHLHTSIYADNLSPDLDPMLYLYPFFTPFYYEEKAEEDNFVLDSEYMSKTRTFYPYGQKAGATLPTEEEDETVIPFIEKIKKKDSGDNMPSVNVDENNYIKIKNYVPYKIFEKDATTLYNEASGYEEYRDYSKLPVADNDLGGVNYNGEKIQTIAAYFDKDFIKKVQENEDRILGVVITPTSPEIPAE